MNSSLAATAASDETPLPSLRARYVRCAFAIQQRGRVPHRSVSSLALRLLGFILTQRPGEYVAHYATIAREFESNANSIMREAHRLRAAGLLRWQRIPPHHPLPNGRFTRTNVLRFEVDVDELERLLATPLSVRDDAVPPNPGTLIPPNVTASTPPKPGASTRSLRICDPQPTPNLLSKTDRSIVFEATTERGEAFGKKTAEELEPVVQAWKRLDLGDVSDRELRALSNRLREGASVEELRDAVAGVDAHPWLRTGARCAFAVVFANVPAVRRFAHEGRRALGSDARSTLAALAPAPKGAGGRPKPGAEGTEAAPGGVAATFRAARRPSPCPSSREVSSRPPEGPTETVLPPARAKALGPPSPLRGAEPTTVMPPEARRAIAGLFARWPSNGPSRDETASERAYKEQAAVERRCNEARRSLTRWAVEHASYGGDRNATEGAASSKTPPVFATG